MQPVQERSELSPVKCQAVMKLSGREHKQEQNAQLLLNGQWTPRIYLEGKEQDKKE